MCCAGSCNGWYLSQDVSSGDEPNLPPMGAWTPGSGQGSDNLSGGAGISSCTSGHHDSSCYPTLGNAQSAGCGGGAAASASSCRGSSAFDSCISGTYISSCCSSPCTSSYEDCYFCSDPGNGGPQCFDPSTVSSCLAQSGCTDSTTTIALNGAATPINARIAGGSTRGVLEVNVDGGGWGAVCDDYFDDTAAQAFCHTMGYSGWAAAVQYDTTHGDGSFALDDVQCPSGASEISDCHVSHGAYTDNCGDSETVGIDCDPQRSAGDITLTINGQSTPLEARIAGGGSRGVLEVNVNNAGWGAVCDDGFNAHTAAAFCHDMGFSSWASAAQYDATHGDSSFALDDVSCPSTATHISDCHVSCCPSPATTPYLTPFPDQQLLILLLAFGATDATHSQLLYLPFCHLIDNRRKKAVIVMSMSLTLAVTRSSHTRRRRLLACACACR
jgi:hypothetical protein